MLLNLTRNIQEIVVIGNEYISILTNYDGALRTAIDSYLTNGKITEQQIDFVKEVISKFSVVEIDNLALLASEKEKLKRKYYFGG